MTNLSERARVPGVEVHARYYPSPIPGLYCSTLLDAGPPRLRIHDRHVLLTLTAGEALVKCRGEVHRLLGAIALARAEVLSRDRRRSAHEPHRLTRHKRQ